MRRATCSAPVTRKGRVRPLLCKCNVAVADHFEGAQSAYQPSQFPQVPAIAAVEHCTAAYGHCLRSGPRPLRCCSSGAIARSPGGAQHGHRRHPGDQRACGLTTPSSRRRRRLPPPAARRLLGRQVAPAPMPRSGVLHSQLPSAPCHPGTHADAAAGPELQLCGHRAVCACGTGELACLPEACWPPAAVSRHQLPQLRQCSSPRWPAH